MVREKLCSYEILEGKIHHLTLHEASRYSIDEMMEQLYQIIETAPKDQTLRTFIDESQAPQMVPLNYIAFRLRDIMERYPERPPGRTVLMLRQNLFTDLLSRLIRIVVRGVDRVRIFPPQQVDEALAWLGRDD